MEQLNLEIRHGHPHSIDRITYPIERPDGFSDGEYAAHADNAANLLARVLTGSPGDILRITGVTMMVVEEGILPEKEIVRQLDKAASKADRRQTWRDAHVIEPKIPV